MDRCRLFFAPHAIQPCPLFSTIQPLPLQRPYACAPKHNQGTEQESLWEAIAEEPDAEEKTDKFAHIERNGDTEGRCSRTEQIYATDADILCKCIGSKIQNLTWYGKGWPRGR